MKIFVTGATGFIGQRLVKKLLADDNQVICYTRNQQAVYELFGNDTVALTDSEFDICGKKYLEQCDAVVNLAGEPVAQKWNPVVKQLIYSSRIDLTKKIAKKINSCKRKPEVLISASAVGYYGDMYDNLLTESTPAGTGFLSDVCFDWEHAAGLAEDLRVVKLRIGVVLGKEGGALKKMLLPFKLSLGGRLGNGMQWMPWIHVGDMVNIIVESIYNTNMAGSFNCVSPWPVRNKEFTAALGSVLKRPAIIPVPKFALELMLGEGASVLLDSQRVKPNRLLKQKFSFQFPDLESALKDILKK